MFDISIPPEIYDIAAAGEFIVSGQISGGKDSMASIHAGFAALDAAGMRYQKVAMHSDLGLIEWRESAAAVETTAEIAGAALHVIPPKGRGLVDRFMSRGIAGRKRWLNLETYHLIGPFSTSSLRFCSSEFKIAPLLRLTGQLFPGSSVLQILGTRRAESVRRRSTPDIARVPSKLVAHGVKVWTWFPIADWSAGDVFNYHEVHRLPLHFAYTGLGSTRLSCCACTLSSSNDAAAAARHLDNLPAFRAMFEIEAFAAFSYASARWAGDMIAAHQPHAWSIADAQALEKAKWTADARRAIEATMPPGLKYVDGWPLRMPSEVEASEIAEARRSLGTILELTPHHATTDGVLARFDELLRAKAAKRAVELQRSLIAA